MALAALLALAAGCGDDAPPSTPDAGPPPVDQCVNAQDTPILAALSVDGGLAGAVDTYIQPCISHPLTPCYPLLFEPGVTEDDVAACVSTCLEGTAVAGLTAGCMLCYGEATSCVTDHCLFPCLGQDAIECPACIQLNCNPRLRECTGIP